MSFYLDTSFVVSAFSKETRSQDALTWLAGHHDDELYTSGWVSSEFSSAIAVKIRTGQFDAADFNNLQRQWANFRSHCLANVAIENEDYDHAASLTAHGETGLRAADALHLAICHRIGVAIVGFDNGLHRAARHFGIAAVTP